MDKKEKIDYVFYSIDISCLIQWITRVNVDWYRNYKKEQPSLNPHIIIKCDGMRQPRIWQKIAQCSSDHTPNLHAINKRAVGYLIMLPVPEPFDTGTVYNSRLPVLF